MLLDKDNQNKLGLEVLEFISHNGTFSCTRNACLAQSPLSKDINLKHGYYVRIALDGDSISNRYKITPWNGLSDNDLTKTKYNERIGKKYDEREERVLPNRTISFPMKDYITRIDFHNDSRKYVHEELLEKLEKLDIPYSFVRKFHSLRESVGYDVNQSNHELCLVEGNNE